MKDFDHYYAMRDLLLLRTKRKWVKAANRMPRDEYYRRRARIESWFAYKVEAI